ncbi:DsbA family protein [Streptomyces cavernae]|uniref:DsbA family protein n=1 Tax=Streptomyces cavernae TaxID=2259034 RepID=UPI000FEB5F99|nr:thioredoxin domain-containing protein [Streptomyces cavernae]
MSERNREGKRTARERLAAERAKQQAANKRRRTLIVGAGVVCVLGLAAVIGVVAANAGKDEGDASGPLITPSGATGKDGLAIPVGRGAAQSTLVVWEDFRCPACKSFEDSYRSAIHELTEAGRLKVEYHLATIIDGNMGGSGSRRAANAAACAQDAGKFVPYHDVLFQNQPPEPDDAYGNDAKLKELARKVDGLAGPAFDKCVDEGRHNAWVAKSADAFLKGGFRGTPAVFLNGKDLFADRGMTPEKFKQMVETADQA